MPLLNNKKYLIINADDFGMSHSTNVAIEELFNGGYITSASLMPCCPWFEEAAQMCRNNPQFDVGLHLTFTSEWEGYRWGSVSRAKSLRDDTGRLFKSCEDFQNSATHGDVLIEMTCQLERCNDGINITNIDNHMGSLFGLETGISFMQQAVAFAAQHKLPYRMPKNFPKDRTKDMPAEFIEASNQLIAFGETNGVRFIDYLLEYPFTLVPGESYESFRAMFLDIILNIKNGVSEIYLHPSVECDEIKSINPHWQKRVWEYMVLKDDAVKAAIDKSEITLIGWKNLN